LFTQSYVFDVLKMFYVLYFCRDGDNNSQVTDDVVCFLAFITCYSVAVLLLELLFFLVNSEC